MVFSILHSSTALTFSMANKLGVLVVVIVWRCDEHPHNWAIAPLLPEASMPAFCLEPKVTGGCNALMTRYFYNAKTGHCEPFTFGGIRGNKNNFLTLEDCKQTCHANAQSLW